ncbi:MAG: tetratricopeptide repeat protein [candidate division NC10 bacterium]|nr:tetratricopeptide repeat protein [candidate division NC10 bacterium]
MKRIVLTLLFVLLATSAHAAPFRVAIFPFEGVGEEGLAEALAEALAQGLRAVKSVKVIEPRVLLRPTGRRPLQGLTLEERIRLGRALKARGLIDGAFKQGEGTLRLTVRFLDLKADKEIGKKEVAGQMAELFALEEKLGSAFLQAFKLPSPPGETWRRAFKLPTPSLPAYFAYARGRWSLATSSEEGYDSALKSFQMALELDENFALARYGLGLTFAGLGYHWRAAWEFTKAFQLDPQLAEAFKALGDVMASTPRKLSQAMEAYQKAIEQDSEYADAYVGLGDIKAAMGELDAALALYERALKADPDSANVHYSLGRLYHHERGLYYEPIGEYQKAIALDPGLVEAYVALGELYEEKGLHQEAVQAYEGAIAIESQNPTALYALAQALEKLDQKKAIAAWERYIQLASSLPSEKEWVEIAKHHLKKLEETR